MGNLICVLSVTAFCLHFPKPRRSTSLEMTKIPPLDGAMILPCNPRYSKFCGCTPATWFDKEYIVLFTVERYTKFSLVWNFLTRFSSLFCYILGLYPYLRCCLCMYTFLVHPLVYIAVWTSLEVHTRLYSHHLTHSQEYLLFFTGWVYKTKQSGRRRAYVWKAWSRLSEV